MNKIENLTEKVRNQRKISQERWENYIRNS